MISTRLIALFLNFIIYIIMIFPLLLISRKKPFFKSKKVFIKTLVFGTIFEIFLSFVVYNFPEKIFSIFSKKTGIVNYAVYAFKILFVASSLFAVKILVPRYLMLNHKKKKAVTLVLSKVTTLVFLMIILFIKYNFKGILFSIPICDIIFSILYFLNVIR